MREKGLERQLLRRAKRSGEYGDGVGKPPLPPQQLLRAYPVQ